MSWSANAYEQEDTKETKAADHPGNYIAAAPGSAGSFTANQVDEFISRRRVPHLFLRVDLLAVDENIQCARGPGTQPNWSTELAFEIVLEAHGLRFQITSKEAAFDLDLHA